MKKKIQLLKRLSGIILLNTITLYMVIFLAVWSVQKRDLLLAVCSFLSLIIFAFTFSLLIDRYRMYKNK